MEPVVAVFMDDEQQDKQTGADANGEPANIDKAIGLVAQQVAPGDGELALKHVLRLIVSYSVSRLFAGGPRDSDLGRGRAGDADEGPLDEGC